MKTRFNSRRLKKGSAILTVVFFVFVMALLTGSMLRYTVGERRSNERTRLALRARNMAENVAVYASEQLTTKLRRLRSMTPMAFLTGSNEISLPPDDVLKTPFSEKTDVEVRAGLTGSTPYTYIDPSNPANASNPNVGLQVSTATVPIISKSTMRHSSVGTVTAYAEQDLQIAMIPLFQFAVFYNMDMEFGPGPNMTISGPVHTNGNLIARIQTGMTNTLRFTDRVTSAAGFFANTAHKGPTYMANGTVDNGPGGDGPLNFQNLSGTITSIKSGSLWRDHKWGTSTVTATTLNNFKTFATSAYGGNLRTSVHGVTTLDLPAIGGYKEVDDPKTPEDERKNGRQIIEPALASDDAALQETKVARKVGLYIIVNPDDEERTGILPNASTVTMRPYSYRCWLNSVNADQSHSMSEVILPGQPSYGDLNVNINNLPNAYREDTSVGANQVLRIPRSTKDLPDTGYTTGTPTFTAFQDAYFYDMRRATNSTGSPFDRPNKPFVPRPISKIDFDMTRFKMAVERTLLNATSSTVYNVGLPTSTNWGSFIYNASASPASHGLGVGSSYDQFPSVDGVPMIYRSSANVYYPSEMTVAGVTRIDTGGYSTYAGRFHVEYSTEAPNPTTWTTIALSASDESTRTFTMPAVNGINWVRISQYMPGGTTVLLDREIIPVIGEGATGAIAVLTNDEHVIASANSGSPPTMTFTDAITEMKICLDGGDDTANWTFTAIPPAGVTVSPVTCPFNNRFMITGMNIKNALVTIRATSKYSGITRDQSFSVQRQDNLVAAGQTGSTRTGRWFTVSSQPGPDPFRMYYAPADPADTRIKTNPSVFEVAPGHLINTSTPYSPWFDGITVYIHSAEAENKNDGPDADTLADRCDSGVRVWNGRGSLISLDGTTYPARTGFTFATNDAAYIVGHYNADGSVVSNVATPGLGGYSGRYPESSTEMLTSVMADAITILSQPVFTTSTSGGVTYHYQNAGWADSLSAHRRTDTTSGYSTSWQTLNPSTSNSQDGINASVKAARMPNLSDITASAGFTAGPSQDSKFYPTVTEVSTCLLTGIVPTSSQTSGGVHNYPRLQEDWAQNTTALYIRGSMVAMFQSQVATEPWSIRYYQGAVRSWGLHESLRNANHDVPLEPIVLNAQRMRYRELNSAEYAAQKKIIEDLPH